MTIDTGYKHEGTDVSELLPGFSGVSSGGGTILAQAPGHVLQLVSGSNITIDVNPGTEEVTISATGILENVSVAWTSVTSKPSTIAGYGISDAITTGNIAQQSVSQALTAGSSVSSGSVPWSGVTGRPSTLSGYGISDAAPAIHQHVKANITDFTHAHDERYLLLSGATMTGPLTLSGDPALPMHAATKRYVDAAAAGLDPKESCRVATTGNVAITSPPATIDNIVMAAGDRVLVRVQTDATQNGIYIWSSTVLTRSVDFQAGNVSQGAFTFVAEGTANGGNGWVLTTKNPNIDTSALAFTQFSGTGAIDAGTGLMKSGNVISLASMASPGTFTKATIDIYGRVVAGSQISAADLPAHTHTKANVIDFVHTHTKADVTDFAHTHDFLTGTTSRPTTRAGYGITDAAPVLNPAFAGTVTLAADPVLALQAVTKQYVDSLGILQAIQVFGATTSVSLVAGAWTSCVQTTFTKRLAGSLIFAIGILEAVVILPTAGTTSTFKFFVNGTARDSTARRNLTPSANHVTMVTLMEVMTGLAVGSNTIGISGNIPSGSTTANNMQLMIFEIKLA